MILLDPSGILAALFDDQRHHEQCAQVMREDDGPLIRSPRYTLAPYDQHWMGDTRDALTLDLRHFRAMRPISNKSFRILPADL